MSVILMNKDMPGNCRVCGAFYLHADASYRCPYDPAIIIDCDTSEGRGSMCPLRELKDLKIVVCTDEKNNCIRAIIAGYGFLVESINLDIKHAKLLRKQLKRAIKRLKRSEKYAELRSTVSTE